jgi:hypothetical protein
MLQIWKYDYFEHLNIVVHANLCTLPFYAFNMDGVSKTKLEQG